jgi:hypothetical protein
MTLAWIARRLHMGSWSHVSNSLRKTKVQKVRTDTGTKNRSARSVSSTGSIWDARL